MRGCEGWNGEVVEGKMGEIYRARVLPIRLFFSYIFHSLATML